MKKVAIFLAAIALTTGVFAQTSFEPPKPTDIKWFDEEGRLHTSLSDDGAEEATGIRRSRAPFTPATLLLLGLSGAVVGTRVVRNTKK